MCLYVCVYILLQAKPFVLHLTLFVERFRADVMHTDH